MKRRMRWIALLVAAGAMLVAAGSERIFDFEFRDSDGRAHRTTRLASEPFLATTRVLVIRAPSLKDERLAKQLLTFTDAWEEFQIVAVISLPDGAGGHGYFATDAANSEKVGALLGSFGVALLDSAGRVIVTSDEPIASTRVKPPLDVPASLQERRQDLVRQRLLDALGPLYPPPDPLSCKRLAIERETSDLVEVSLFESHGKPCDGISEPSSRLDRFRVQKRTGAVQRYEASAGEWHAVGSK